MKRPFQALWALFLTVFAVSPLFAQGFGSAVAVGEQEVLIGEAQNTRKSGVVYVYQPDAATGTWTETGQLTPTNAVPGDAFGQAMALDGNTVLIGAPQQNEKRGAAYLFTRGADGQWNQTAQLTDAGSVADDQFGSTVALHGDMALVGAANRDGQTGAVYVYQRRNDTWEARGQLVPMDFGAGDRLGTALALENNVALVGVPGRNGTGVAIAFAYDPATDAWRETGVLADTTANNGSRFGMAVALHNGMAYVGAPRHNGGRGAVWTFAHEAEGWTTSAILEPEQGEEANAQRLGFGGALTVTDTHLWVGAPDYARRTGKVFAYALEDGTWTPATLMPENAQPRIGFGQSMAARGNLAVFGMTGDDYQAGTAAVFAAGEEGWTQAAKLFSEVDSFAAVVGEKVTCADGHASAFDCQKMDLVSFLPVKDIGGKRGVFINDIWGWTDAETGKEYVLVGRADGTSFVDVSDPSAPRYLGDLPKTEGVPGSTWRDVKVYQNHAYIVADGADAHGMQVFDLTQLRTVESPPVTFEATTLYDQIHSAHNIVINEATGFAYAVGSSSGGETCGGGLHMINIQEPANPTFAGCFSDPNTGRRGTGYTHDAQCVTYNGPDETYQGREICFGANETALSIADVTDKDDPKALSTGAYPNVAYTHQGWLTEDQRYFYLNDELDEISGRVDGTRTLVWDVSDLDDPQLIKEHIAESKAIDHNLYVRDNFMYQSNYMSGLRVLDVTDAANPVEVGYFDTVPYGTNDPTFGGSWSNFPFFKSGIIAVTSMSEGLFLLRKNDIDI